MQRSLSNAMPNQQQPDEQLDMAEMQQGQLGTPRNSLPPYINPYQSFPNPGTMQVIIRPILGETHFNVCNDRNSLQSMILLMHIVDCTICTKECLRGVSALFSSKAQ